MKNQVAGMSLKDAGIPLPPYRGERGEKLIDTTPRNRMSSDVTFPFQLPLARGPRQVDSGFTNYFEALTPTQDRTPIPLYIYAIRSVLQTFNRVQLAFIARYLYDNDGMVSLAVDTIADYCAPVQPIPSVKDPVIAQLHAAYWEDWKKRADFSGRFGFDMLQRLACKALDVDGDILPVMVAENGFPQVQMLETWRVDSRAIQNNVLHIDGVAVDNKQSVTGYYVINQLNNFMVGVTLPEFVSASNAILLYDPDRFSAYRGMSPLRRGGNDIRDAKDIKGFEKTAAKIHSALAAVIEGGTIEEDDWGNDTGTSGTETPDAFGDPMAGNKPPVDATQQEKKLSLWELLGGDIPVLPNGQKLNLLQNQRGNAQTVELIQTLAGFMVAGLGLPPSFVIQGGHTGPGERSVNGKAQRKFNNRQTILGHFAEWAYIRVIAHGIANDGLPAAPGWDKPEWQGPPKVSIDDGRDAQQWREDFAQGLMTRQNHFGNRALSWQRETDQGFLEDAYIIKKAKEIADETGVDIQIILNRWGYAQAKPAPPPAPGGEENNSGGNTPRPATPPKK
jgi:capsid protein